MITSLLSFMPTRIVLNLEIQALSRTIVSFSDIVHCNIVFQNARNLAITETETSRPCARATNTMCSVETESRL